jgi:NCS1 family nucleobase:cation symporter-1
LSGTAGAVVYAVLCKIWPVQVYPNEHQSDANMAWEAMVPTEGFFHDDETMPEYVRNKVLFGVKPTTIVAEQDGNARQGDVGEKEYPLHSKS